MKKNHLISIITVCYNAQSTIRKTLESVLRQDYRPIQYIIIDGNSSDFTMTEIEGYREQFHKAGIDLLSISEEDYGIYNAMNKGARIADGEWIAFMNADDFFYDRHALSSVEQYLQDSNIDVIYGDEYICDIHGNGTLNKRKKDIFQIEKTLPFCHQSSLVRKKWLQIHPFDEHYLIVADYEFFLFCFKHGAKFQYSDTTIASYFKGGISRKLFRKAIDENFEVKGKYGMINCKRLDFIIKKELRKIYTSFQIRGDQ